MNKKPEMPDFRKIAEQVLEGLSKHRVKNNLKIQIAMEEMRNGYEQPYVIVFSK